MPARPLTLHERVAIRVGIERDDPDHVIGEALGRHRCTINAEICRNGGRGDYCAIDAQHRAEQQRSRPKVPKLVADPALAAHVTKRLQAKDSPMTISIELARGVRGRVASISHECIYQAVYSVGRGLAAGLHVGLHLTRRRRKHRGRSPVVATHSLGSFNLIGARPEIAAQRTKVGHIEGDLIVGAYNRSAIATMFDRTSRYVWLARLPHAKNADGVLDALIATLRRIPSHLRVTLTWDQGSEMARHLELAKRCGIDIYFAEPKAPWQRPTNENGNALVRRYVGKGTDLSIYTTRDLRAIERRINTIPRRSLNWATANDIYTAAVAMTG
ncbi:MAG TPA: IS30 family transposase [Ilumatobacteraceae bacterium]|nr:IS30 family transposase [Ilumatobacteraceae bacterium]